MAKELNTSKTLLNRKENELTKSLSLMDEMNSKLTELASDNSKLYDKYNESQVEFNDINSNPNHLVKQIQS